MSRLRDITIESFFDGFTGAGLFGCLRWPGSPTYLIDPRGLEELKESGDYDVLLQALGVPAPVEPSEAQKEAVTDAKSKIEQLESSSSGVFADKLLTCADCGGEFIFTAGEQLFFFDKQFKNDPKRCKLCKSKRAGASMRPGVDPAAAGLSRTEIRTECSECGIETTVPFKPTQGRPVLCRQCFQNKRATTSHVDPGFWGNVPREEVLNDPGLYKEKPIPSPRRDDPGSKKGFN